MKITLQGDDNSIRKILTMILASILTFTLAPHLANAKTVEQEQLNVTEVHRAYH